MNIVVISTAALPTPSYRYSGMERVSNLVARGLEELGNDVEVIAKRDSRPQIRRGCYGINSEMDIPVLVSQTGLDTWADVFIDISHDKTLLRARPDLKVLQCYQAMSQTGTNDWPVLISYGQWRDKFPQVKEAEIMRQPIDFDELKFYDDVRDNYLLYMGQRIEEKRLEWAMELAVRTNTPLKTYSPGWGDAEYHKMLYAIRDAHPDLISIESDIGGDEKLYALQHAKALIHPVGGKGWCEAGAIVVLEALAVGTPVIVSDNGCLPEYVDTVLKRNGFVCRNVDEMVDALEMVDMVKPQDCRNSVIMHDYKLVCRRWENLCERVIRGERWNV